MSEPDATFRPVPAEEILEEMTVGFMRLDAAWRITYVNAAAEKTNELTRQALLGRIFWDAFPAVPGTDVEHALRQAMSERVPVRVEHFYEPYGCWFEADIQPLGDGGLAFFGRDITDRRMDEERQRLYGQVARKAAELAQGESQLSEAQQLAHVGSWNWDLATDRLSWSDEHYRICGLERDGCPMTFERGISVIHPEDLSRVRRTVDEALRERTSYECSLRLVRPDGSIRFVHSRGRTVFDPAGKPVRMYGTLQDVTERVRAEEALRVANEQLDLAMRGSNIGIWDVDLPTAGDYRRDPVRFLNVWEQLGYAPAEFPVDASASRSLGHPGDLPLVDAAVTACLAGESDEIRVENRIRHKDGSYHWLLTLGKAIRDASGTPVRLIGTIFDITDRKRHEAELQRTREAAEAANRSKDEFLAVMSHELRTPLGAILLWSEMLAAGTVNPAKYHDVFRAIRESALAQHRLIEDLLDVSNMMSGDFRLKARDQELAPVVRAAIDTVRPSAESKGIEIAVSFDESAGQVSADSYRMQQVVWNLVNNAVKFSGQGGRVAVSVRRVRNFVQVRVADTGQGIAPEFLPYVFDRFRQADSSSTRAHGGLGLGMAIVRRLVELHGGTVRAESPGEGGGSTFTVEIPLADARFPSDAGGRVWPASDEPAFAPSPVLRGVRVLLVEDEPQTRTVVQWVLEQCEAEVTAVENAGDALEAFRAAARGRRFDAMLSDIGMPGQDGHELMRRVRALEREAGEPKPLPAVALTAYAGEEERKKALEAGFFLHLPKPIGPAALVRTVAKAIGQGGAEAEPQ